MTYMLYGGLMLVAALLIINLLRKRGIPLMSPTEANERRKDPALVFLDVRTKEEFAGGHIKGARLLPLSELPGRIPDMGAEKDRPFIVYCRSGHRSATAAAILAKNGFSKISSLDGGIVAWQAQGFETIQ
jgi:rhodanese-related sulfurtransferase